MSYYLKRWTLVTLSFLVTSCSQLPTKPTDLNQQKETIQPILLFEQPKRKKDELTGDMLFSYLSAEIATKEGDLALAYNHYNYLSQIDNDPYVAKRRYLLADYNNKKDKTRKQEAFDWVKNEPNSLEAHLASALAYLKIKQQSKAEEELKIALKLMTGKDKITRLEPLVTFLLKSKQATESFWLMDKMVQYQNKIKEVYYLKGILEVSYKQYDNAVVTLHKAKNKDLHWTKPWLAIAMVHQLLQRPALVLETLKSGVKENPDDIILIERYNSHLLEKANYKEAYPLLKKLHQKQPDKPRFLFLLAGVAIQLEKWDEAESYWLKVKETQTTRKAAALYFLGLIYEQKKDYSEALNYFKQIKSTEYLLEATIRMAEIYKTQGNVSNARALFSQLRKKDPETEVKVYFAEIAFLKDSKQINEIFKLFKQALTTYPDNIDILYERALFSADQGKIKMMEQDAKKILSISPKHADTLNVLGYTLADNNIRLDEAYQYISLALKLEPKSPAILDSMGWVEYRRGNYTKAVKYLSSANLLLDDAELAAHLGEVLWAKGEKKKAEQIWRDAWSKYPKHRKLLKTINKFQPKIIP